MDPQTIHRRRWAILGVMVISLLVVVLDNTVLNVALKTIADPRAGLGATQSELEWAINSYTLVFAGLLFTAGVIGDRLGRRRTLMIGLALFGLASAVSAYAQTPGQLIAARALMGLGGAAVMPQTLSIITNVFHPTERPRAIGIWAGAVGLALGIGPVTGGLLLAHFWWGSVFLINVPIVAVGLLAMALLVPESRNPRPGRIDPVGVLASIVGLTALTYGIIRGGQLGSFGHVEVLGALLVGLAILAFFAWYEARIDHPALDVRLFRDPRLSASVGAIGLLFFGLAGVIFFITFYLQSVRGYTPLQSGLLVLPVAVAQILFASRTATMVRRFGAKAVATTGMLLVAGALFGYQLLGLDTPIWVLEVIYFVQGVGMGIVIPPATESVMSALPRERAGAGSAIQNTVRQVSVALGVAVLGSVLSAAYRGRMEGPLAALPTPLRHIAGESVEGTLAVANRVGPAGVRLVEPAHQAFIHAMHTTALASAIIAFFGALVVFAWLPGKTEPKSPVVYEETEPESVSNLG